jgi:Carboxypeptidase regulatory-like domain
MRFNVRIGLITALAPMALLVMFATSGAAQTFNSSLGGTVTDTSGAVVPNAVVTAIGIETGVGTKAKTNTSGVYEFPSLPQGVYRVIAEMAGFKQFAYQKVTLDVGAQVRLNFTLEVGAATTTVEVTAAAESPLMATSAVVGGVVTGDEILHLPLIDQNAANLALTQAEFAGGIGTGVSVAGGSTLTLATTVNGISVSNNRLDRAGGLLSFQLTQTVDMVEEVKVTSSPADAESGRSLGQVQMIVRSGTNQFHGSLVDGLRNTDLDANTFWNNFNQPYLPRQILIRNQFAARIGGPIRKNKTFFFVLYDGNRQRTSATGTNTVLTSQARQGNYRFFPGATNSNFAATSNPVVDAAGNPVQPSTATGPLQTISLFGRDPNRPIADASGVVQKLIGLTPLPNNFTVGDGLNTAGYSWAIPSYADLDQFTFKLDHYINQNNHISVVVTHEHQYYTSTTSIFPTAPVTGDNQDHSWFTSVNFDSTIKPNLLNQFKIGMQHPDLLQDSGVLAYPQLYPKQNSTTYIPGLSSFTSPIPGSIESELIDPVYTIGDSMTWTRGKHTIKWGFQVDYTSTNSYNINNNVTPAVTLGAGSTAVQGINNVPGLVSANQTLATSILTDLTGSVSSIAEGFGVANGKNPQWIVYPSRAAFEQRDANGFIKDDFKVASNLTVNFGMRWDWVGVPWEKWGRELSPSTGFAGAFGISGTNFGALWNPGASGGALTQMQTVGPNSANPGQQLYKNYYKSFEPALGLSWAIPYFGKNKTVLRVGYGMSRPMTLSFLDISGVVTQFATSATFSAVAPTFLNNINLPLSPTFTNPLQVWPVNDKTQSIVATDPNFKPTVVQSYNVSLERQLTSSLSLAVRYVGNHTTHMPGGFPLNTTNVFENGIAAATVTTAQGGNAPLFNQLLMGVTVPGVGTVNGTTLTGSQAMMQYSGTYTLLATNSAGGIANFFNTTQALAPAGTTPARGWLIANAGLPANFVVVNPQYNGVTAECSCLNASYNSGIVELIKRFSHGLVFNGNVVWAKNMTLNGFGLNPRNWDAQRQAGGQKFTWKASGTYELPFGKGKRFLNATSGAAGVIDKIVGNWQYGGIFTLNSGSYLNFTCAGNPTGGTNPCTSAQPMGSDPGKVIRTGNGVVYYNPSQFTQGKDPFCSTITNQFNLQSRCTDLAISYNGSPLFENSALGQQGNMNLVSNWKGPGLFDFDMNLLKRFTVKERITAEFRVDAISATNTPHFPNPTTNINSTSFGRITAPSAGGSNSFTTPAVFYGNRVFVANLRVSF